MYNLNLIKRDLYQILPQIYTDDRTKEEILGVAEKVCEAAAIAEEKGLGALSDQLNPEEDDDISLLYAYFLEKILTGMDPEVIEETMVNIYMTARYTLLDEEVVKYYMVCAGMLALQDGKNYEAVYSLMECLIPTYLWGEFYHTVHEKSRIKMEITGSGSDRNVRRYLKYADAAKRCMILPDKDPTEDEDTDDTEDSENDSDMFSEYISILSPDTKTG